MKMTLKLAALLLITSGAIQQAKADECTLEISSNDAMQFDQSSMQAPASCSEVTVKLTHSGSLPANAMGHNWVLTTAADFQAVANAGMTAGLDNNYVPVDDARVLAATKIIGGGETTEVTFDTSGLSAGESYTFFCSFPGHWAIMKGEFTLAS